MRTSDTLLLTSRDTQMLLAVYFYGGCRIEHLARRYFPGTTASAPYRRIAKLVEAGYLSCRRLPAASGIGSGPAFLTVGMKARPLLARDLHLSRSELTRIRLQAPGVIAHHLALLDVRLSIELACERSNVFTLVELQGDGEVVLRVTDPETKSNVTLIPDATFALALSNGTEQSFFVELDMGTMPRKRMKARLRAYVLLAKTEPTPVLFVVPDATRQAAIARWATEEAAALAADPTVFWLTTKGRVTEQSVIASPIWTVVGLAQPISLHEAAGGTERIDAHGRQLASASPTLGAAR